MYILFVFFSHTGLPSCQCRPKTSHSPKEKQKEYFAFIDHYYDSRNDEVHQDTYRQVGTRFLFLLLKILSLGGISLGWEVLYLAGP